MTASDLTWMVVGWQVAILVRFCVDLFFSWTDERKRRRARAARPITTA